MSFHFLFIKCLGSETPTLSQLADQSWVWIIDLQRTCALLIGQCLGGIFSGERLTLDEIFCRNWLKTELFSAGLENDDMDIQTVIDVSQAALVNNQDALLISLENMKPSIQDYCKMAFKLPYQYDEACAVRQEDTYTQRFFDRYEFEWDTDGNSVDTVVQCFLITLLKQSGLGNETSDHSAYSEIYKYTFKLRQRLINLKFCYCDDAETEKSDEEGQIFAITCRMMLQRCLFLLFFVKPLKIDTSESNSDEDDSNREYTNFYKNLNCKEITKVCSLCYSFVCNEPAEKVSMITHGSINNHWSSEPIIVYKALVCQKSRAQARLESLEYLLKLITEKRATSTVSNVIYPQLLAGYFGFCNYKSEDVSKYLFHYLDNIQACPITLQEEVRNNMHKLYDFLIRSLHRENRQLLMTTLFSLTVRYEPEDLNFVIRKNLLGSLISINETKTDILNASATRLSRILALCACVHSKKIHQTTLETIIDKLYNQFTATINDARGVSVYSVCDKHFSDFLLFLRIITSSKLVKVLLASRRWLNAFLSVLDTYDLFLTYPIQLKILRPKMTIFQILQNILPALQPKHIHPDLRSDVVNKLFTQMGKELWKETTAETAPDNYLETGDLNSLLEKEEDDNIPVLDMGFDIDKSHNCHIEGNLTLIHDSGGRGYGLGFQVIRSGCYQWKILIVNENRGNEGTCIGVSKYPIRDYSHRSTSDMWLYRAYSGSLYHSGERDTNFPSYSQGDYITVVLDMDSKTLSFGKNGEEPRVAFDNVDAPELYPCVMFYSTSPGEKVKITDMKVGKVCVRAKS